MSSLSKIIEVKEGYIQNSPVEYGVNAIVNAANPTLMGREGVVNEKSVDRSIHEEEARLQGKKGALKALIKEKTDGKPDGEENAIRCKRGEVVVTEGQRLCKYILHTVGPENDQDAQNNRWPRICSSSRIRILESCYRNIIMETVKRPDIKKLAIPVISSGNYHMPFELAFKVCITTIYNTLLEEKQRDREFFEFIGLSNVYIIIPEEDKREKAEEILTEYKKVFYQEHRVVAQNSWESQLGFFKEIQLYDERRGFFSAARVLRTLLVIIRLVFSFPFTYMKDWFGKKDWVKRRKIVEQTTILKMLFPIAAYFVIKICNGNGIARGIWALVLYNLLDTVTYLLALIILADIQKPSANIIRSLILLCVNYVEVSLELAVLYFWKYYGQIRFRTAMEAGFFDKELEMVIANDWSDYVLHYMDKGVKFFFLTLAFGYFANHLRQRKFRQLEEIA